MLRRLFLLAILLPVLLARDQIHVAAQAATPTIVIQNPLSDQTYRGTITVQAAATGAATVTYQVDSGPLVPMTFHTLPGAWTALLDTTTLSPGTHNVTVAATGSTGVVVTDRAWNIHVATATPVATSVVTPTATAAPIQDGAKWFGYNDGGGEFGNNLLPGTYGVQYTYTADPARNAYFAGKGLRLIRYPFRWERIQRTLLGPLSPTDVAGLRAALDTAQAAHQQVILDLHNYAQYNNVFLTRADAPKLADVWRRVALEFRGHPALYGYALMNQPHDLPEGASAWYALAQAAADGVRAADPNHFLLVPGYGWQTAAFWPENNGPLDVHDPSNKVLYDAHQYFDADNSGTYMAPYDSSGATPTIGVERLQPFFTWLNDHHFQGIMTEYGVPDNDPRWNVVLDNFLAALQGNPRIVGGTYWAAGVWWGTYPLSIEPNGQDRPQMSVLAKYPTTDGAPTSTPTVGPTATPTPRITTTPGPTDGTPTPATVTIDRTAAQKLLDDLRGALGGP